MRACSKLILGFLLILSPLTTNAGAPSNFTKWPNFYGLSGTYGAEASAYIDTLEMEAHNMRLHTIRHDVLATRIPEFHSLGAKVIVDFENIWRPILCPNGACQTPTQTIRSQISTAISAYLAQIGSDPMYVGFWVLDDALKINGTLVDVRPILDDIHALVQQSNSTTHLKRLTVCGFSANLDYTGQPATSLEAFDNFTPTGCDIVAPYSYAVPPSGAPNAVPDWTMTGYNNLLGRIKTKLTSMGWNSATQPLIGVPQAFGRPAGGYQTPTASEVTTQISSYCDNGAIAIIPFIWRNDGGDAEDGRAYYAPANNTDLKTGMLNGLKYCRSIWEKDRVGTIFPIIDSILLSN